MVMCQVWMESLGGRETVKPSGVAWESSANSFWMRLVDILEDGLCVSGRDEGWSLWML